MAYEAKSPYTNKDSYETSPAIVCLQQGRPSQQNETETPGNINSIKTLAGATPKRKLSCRQTRPVSQLTRDARTDVAYSYVVYSLVVCSKRAGNTCWYRYNKDVKMPAIRYLVYGQLCFYIGLLFCAVLKQSGLTINEGISYYGVFRLTIVPYAVGLLGSAYFCARFASQLNAIRQPFFSYSFFTISILIVGVVFTPDTLGRFFNDAHMTFGTILFVVQLLLSGWIIHCLRYDAWAIVLSLIELAGGIVSFIYLGPAHGYLLESQLLFQVSFGILGVYSMQKLLPQSAHLHLQSSISNHPLEHAGV